MKILLFITHAIIRYIGRNRIDIRVCVCNVDIQKRQPIVYVLEGARLLTKLTWHKIDGSLMSPGFDH